MSTAIGSLFTPGINKHFGLRLDQCPSMYKRVFHSITMDGRVLFRQGWQTYGPPEITLPLNPVHMDEIRESFSKGYTPIKRTLGDLVAEEDWDDDEYGVLRRVIPARAGAMAEVFAEKREYDAANYLAVTAYSAASPVPGSPDGVALFSASHPVSLYNSGTTASNVSSAPVALSNTSYYAAYASMAQQKAANNYTILCKRPSILVYNPVNRAVAVQLARGDWERGTNNFNMNAAKEDSLELIEWPHYQKTLSTSAAGSYDGWALLSRDHMMNFVTRQDPRAKSDYDMNKQAYVWVMYTRYDIGHDDWRGTYSTAS